jgi:hypothetical protein
MYLLGSSAVHAAGKKDHGPIECTLETASKPPGNKACRGRWVNYTVIISRGNVSASLSLWAMCTFCCRRGALVRSCSMMRNEALRFLSRRNKVLTRLSSDNQST